MKPTFVLSVDVEGLWGVFFVERYRKDLVSAEQARNAVPRMLEILDERRIPATFATVGHLFLDRCERDGDLPHPDMPRPNYPWWPDDWYRHDPCSDESTDPDWYGRSLVSAIADSPGGHELASHGFSHAIIDEQHCPAEVAEAEFRRPREVAEALNIELRSFVYPQNVVGHRRLLAPAGYSCFRAPDGGVVQRAGPPGGIGRAARLARHVMGAEPPVGLPRQVDGLVEIPSSMPIVGGAGLRTTITRGARVARARRGLDAAEREGAVFHLWTHPHAFSGDQGTVIESFIESMDLVAERRDRGRIQVRTMDALARDFIEGAPVA